jgi:hypothetical protein
LRHTRSIDFAGFLREDIRPEMLDQPISDFFLAQHFMADLIGVDDMRTARFESAGYFAFATRNSAQDSEYHGPFHSGSHSAQLFPTLTSTFNGTFKGMTRVISSRTNAASVSTESGATSKTSSS